MNRSLTATIFIAMALGLYFTVTKTVLSDASKVNQSNKDYEQAISNANKILQKFDELTDKKKRIGQDNLDKLEKMLPQKVDNIRLIIDLNSIAFRYGFVLKGIQATAATAANTQAQPATQPGMIPAPALETVTVTFGVSAPYQQFISFLQDLESTLRIMDITGLSVNTSESGVYDWKVELKTYWLKK